MRTLIVAPHPDDELLGCGGTLLRRRDEGADIGWILVTEVREDLGYSSQRVEERFSEIELVRGGLGVKRENMYSLGFSTAELDVVPMKTLVDSISSAVTHFQPKEVLLPFFGDAHSDHRKVFEAASACMKWFRAPSIRRVLLYETVSETDIALNGVSRPFQPNYYSDIGPYVEQKIQLLANYDSEIGVFPFPRSPGSLRSLAMRRGSEAGFSAAEAFELVLERV